MGFKDDFTGTAGTLLNGRQPTWSGSTATNEQWTLLLGTNDISLDGSGHLKRATGTSAIVFYGTGSDGATSQSITADFYNGLNCGVALLGAVSGSNFNGYLFTPKNSTTMRIYRVVNNVQTSIWESSALANTLGLTISVSLNGSNQPVFSVKQGGTTVGTAAGSLTDTTPPSTAGQRGVLVTSTSAFAEIIGNYQDDYTPPAAVTWTITEPANGRVFEGLKTTSSVSIPVSWAGSPGNVQARIVSGGAAVPGFDWTTKVSSPAANSSATLTFSGIPAGGPYSVQVRDTSSGIEKDGSNQWSVGGVVVIWGRSQADKVFNLGWTDTLAPTGGSQASIATWGPAQTTPAAPGAAFTIGQLSGGQGGYSGGIVAAANQWQADTSNTPVMFVDCAVPGMAITDFINDMTLSMVVSGVTGTFQAGENITAAGGLTGYSIAVSGSTLTLSSGSSKFTAGATITGATSGATATISSVWNLWSGFVTSVLNAIGNQASGVIFLMADTGAPAFNSSYAGYMETIQTKFAALMPSYASTYAVIPQLRSDASQYQDGLRQAMLTAANSGAPLVLGGYQSDHQLHSDGDVHQAGGATGNQRIGALLGRVAAWQCSNSSLQRFGPIATDVRFTDNTYTAIRVTFDRNVKMPAGGSSGVQGVFVSTNNGSSFADPPGVGYTAAITAANQVTITKSSGTWTLGQTCIDFLRGVPFSSNSGEPQYMGITEANMETQVLSKLITDTSGFNGGRGLTVKPVMGSGIAVADYTPPSSGVGIFKSLWSAMKGKRGRRH